MKKMTSSLLCLAFVMTLAFPFITSAQSPPPAPSPATAQTPPPAASQVPQMPPDQQAFMDANRVKDPKKKIEALEKFTTDFPNSFNVFNGYQAIFVTLVKNFPNEKEKILANAQLTIDKSPDSIKGFAYNTIVTNLIDAGILLDKAEEFAIKGLSVTEEEIAKSATQRRAPMQVALGRVYLKNGKTARAEKLLKEAYKASPSSTAAEALAEIAMQKGKEDEALDYYATAVTSGKVKPESRKKLDDLYRKTHNGSLDGIEDMLDVKYEKAYPNPVHDSTYQPAANRSDRVVLAEVFTGSGCPPCVAADLAFDVFLERYTRKDVIVVMYHQHIPQPDPMTNPSTIERAKFYAVRGVPSYSIDGNALQSGGGSRDMTQSAYSRFKPEIERQLTKAPEAKIQLDAALSGSTVKINAGVDSIKGDSKDLRLQVLLVEEKLRYTGENGVRFHPMVVRSIGGEKAGGFAVEAGKAASVSWEFQVPTIVEEAKKHLDEYEKSGRGEPFTFSEKKHEIDATHLAVVAFVQDNKTKAVLQSVYVSLKPMAQNSLAEKKTQ